MSSPNLERDNLRGGLLMTLGMAFFACEDALLKGLTAVVPSGQLLFLVGLISAMVMGVILLARSRGSFLSSEFTRLPFALRNVGEIFGGVGFITTLKLMPLSTGSALLQTLPLVMTLGAALFLGEKVGIRRWSAIAVGFIGVIIILRPTGDGFSLWAAGAAALTVIGLAIRDLSTRRLGPSAPSTGIAFWGMLSYSFSGLLLMFFTGQEAVSLSGDSMIALGCAGLLGLCGYYVMIVATRVGEVAAITPYRYSRIVFALILGFLVFNEHPDRWVLIGSGLIIASGLYTFLRERYHAFHNKAK